MNQIEKKGYAYIFTAGLLWGTIGIFLKEMAGHGASAIEISFLRMIFAFLCMLVITVAKEGKGALKIGRKELLCCLLLGLVCHGLHNIMYSLAVSFSGVSVSAVVMNIAPAVTLITAFFLFGEAMTYMKVTAILMNILGCTLAVTGGDFSFGTVSVIGILCSVFAGATYGMVGIIGKFAMEKMSIFVTSTYSYLFAALILIIPAKPWDYEWNSSFLTVIMLAFALALIPTSIGYILYYKGLGMIGDASNASVIASNQTIVAAILGMVIYGEEMNLVCWMGITVVLFSIVLMNRKGKGLGIKYGWQRMTS